MTRAYGPRSLAVALCCLLATSSLGCMTLSTGSYFEDSLRFSPRPDQALSVEPVAKVNETLVGFHLLGFRVKPIEPLKLREQYLEDESYRVTNWQLTTANLSFIYLDFLFTIPYAHVIFDIVEVR